MMSAEEVPAPRRKSADNDAPQGRVAQLAPLLEGGILALLVMVVMTLGGETVRTGYEGYLHVAAGEAVLHDGLVPENPYHAGTVLPSPTLYPLLGVLLGKLFGGALWGFAILNVLGAALFAPALDSLGRTLKLSTLARRFALLAAVLMFNGLGWFGALHQAGGDVTAAMALGETFLPPQPILSLLPLSLPDAAIHWDARLQAFLPGLLEVAAFALTLPFLLLAVSWSLRPGSSAQRKAVLCAAIATALAPQVGGIAAIVVLGQLCVGVIRNRVNGRNATLSAALFLVICLPFLLPLLFAPVGPPSPFEFAAASPLWNLVGPLFLLLVLAGFGLRKLAPRARKVVGVVCAALMLAVLIGLPGNEGQRWVRVLSLFLALPAGAFLAQLSKRRVGTALAVGLCLLCLPTTVRSFQAYRNWDMSEALTLTVQQGDFVVTEERMRAWPPGVAEAEAALPADAILIVHPSHPGARIGGLMATLGNTLQPIFKHPLYVDAEHRFNRGAEDLARRQELCIAVWGLPGAIPMGANTPATALAKIRSDFAGRTIAVVVSDRPAADEFGLQAAGGELHATEAGVRLWVFPPLPEAADES